MGAARIIILSIALVAAVGLAVVIRNMLAKDDTPVAVAQAKAPEVLMTRVLVAKRDLPVGTTIQPTDLGWQPWPADGLSKEYFTDGSAPRAAAETAVEKVKEGAEKAVAGLSGDAAMENMVGAVVREAIALNDPIVERKIVRGGEGGYLAVVLQPGMRAIGVPVSVESGAGGFILPGDRVDVLQSRESTRPEGATVRITEAVVTNVKVLAIDQNTVPAEDSHALVGNVATLEVDSAAAEALVEARQRGEMQLVLRSYADAGQASGRATPRGPRGQAPAVRIYSQGETVEVAVPQ